MCQEDSYTCLEPGVVAFGQLAQGTINRVRDRRERPCCIPFGKNRVVASDRGYKGGTKLRWRRDGRARLSEILLEACFLWKRPDFLFFFLFSFDHVSSLHERKK